MRYKQLSTSIANGQTEEDETMDTETSPSESERPDGKVQTLPNGDTLHEADDCRFVSSPSGTVHERDEWDGDAHDYHYHPRCGQRLSANSMWSHVDADNVAEAVLKYDLKPCGRCIPNASRLDRFRSAIHSNLAYSSADDVPDDVLRKAGLERYLDSDGQ